VNLLGKFEMVDIHGKMNLINEQGEYIISIEYYRNKLNLYALPGFYAEIYYDPDINRIIKIESITDIRGLNKYLPFVEVGF
jgi:hypothetical protein